MSATTEGPPHLWLPGHGDLQTWYRTLEVYAASAPPNNTYFHGPHIAPAPVPLRRVEDGLRWLETQHKEELAAMPLPTLEQMRAELEARRPPGGMTPLDSGSPCHNLWHWINGS